MRFLSTNARIIATAFALVLVIGYFDYVTGPQISFGIFYLVPISLVAWLHTRRVAIVTACACAAVWLAVDRMTNRHAPASAAYWNMCVRLGFFLLITLLLNRLRFLASNLEAKVKERTADLVAEVERRKQAEEVVREREERFRQLAENINEVFWMSDLDKKRIIYVSPGYEEIWGRTCESLYASPRNWLEAIHPDDRDRVSDAALTKQISGQYIEEYRVVRPDGSLRWIQDRAFPVHDESGKVYRIVGIAEDITERKQAESVLRESEERFRTLFEFSPFGMAVHRPNGRLLQTNGAYQRLVGYAADELQRLGVKHITHADDVAESQRLFGEICEGTRDHYQREKRYRRKDGSLVWGQSSVSAVRDNTGRLRLLISIVEDIDTRKRTEKQSAAFASLAYQLNAAVQSQEAAQIIMDAAREFFGWDAGYLHLYSPIEDRIIPILTVDTVNGQLTNVPASSFTTDPSPLMRQVLDTGAHLINRTANADTVPLTPFGDSGRLSASMMYVPIHSNSAVVGVLSIQSYTPHAYCQNDLAILQMLADHCGDAVHRIKLATTTRELASIVENSRDAIISKTLDGTIISWNKGAERLYGYTEREMKGCSISVLIPPNSEDDISGIVARIARGERDESFETARIRKDGARVDVSLNVSPIRDSGGQINGVSVIARDITERKRLEREIAEISHNEQQRLAHELHDQLGAYLAGIAFRAKALAERLHRRALPEADEALRLVNLVNEGTSQVRNFARVLAPIEMANGGIAAGLARWGAEIETLFGIVCRIDVAPDLPVLTSEQSLQLYRIAQEATRNAIQHAKAGNVEISVRHESDFLIQTIRNDGQAWNPANENEKSLGLRIMRYRAGTLGGALTVQSESDGRTAVICRVPLRSITHAGPGFSDL